MKSHSKITPQIHEQKSHENQRLTSHNQKLILAQISKMSITQSNAYRLFKVLSNHGYILNPLIINSSLKSFSKFEHNSKGY